jgi:recombination DNA repair RAD52 pathway protein
METLYIKLNISKLDTETDAIREAGLLFENIAEAVALDRNNIEEIDKSNYLSEIKNINNKYSK